LGSRGIELLSFRSKIQKFKKKLRKKNLEPVNNIKSAPGKKKNQRFIPDNSACYWVSLFWGYAYMNLMTSLQILIQTQMSIIT